MKNKNNILINNQKGAVALILAVLVLSSLLIVSLFFSNLVIQQIKLARQTGESINAYQVADSGAEYAIYKINTGSYGASLTVDEFYSLIDGFDSTKICSGDDTYWFEISAANQSSFCLEPISSGDDLTGIRVIGEYMGRTRRVVEIKPKEPAVISFYQTSDIDFGSGTFVNANVIGTGDEAYITPIEPVLWTRISTNWVGDIGSYAVPEFADMDADGDYDMAVGNSSGKIFYFRNDGDSLSPVWTQVSINWVGDVGKHAAPAIADMDADGDYDMAVGRELELVYFFKNNGDASSYSWVRESTNWLGEIDDDYVVPAFADINGDNDYDLAIGREHGSVKYYENIGGPLNPTWREESSSWVGDVGDHSAPAFVDIDEDLDYDMAVGNEDGMIYFYRNNGNSSSPSWTRESTNWIEDVGTHAAPTFEDMDGDGDYDAAVGNRDGRVRYFENNTVGSEYVFISAALNVEEGGDIDFTTLEWNTIIYENTQIDLQLRSAATEAGLSSADWYGPTGVDDYYTASPQEINAIHDGDEWIQYKAVFTVDGFDITPELLDITINYTN